MIRFYAPDIESTHTLPESDSGHCVRVLRMHTGDSLEVVDGKGTLYHCVLLDPHPKHATVDIISSEPLPKVWRGTITIAIAPTKNNDRMEWLVEKLTEIGVDRIIPLRCRYSERKDINVERLNKIAVSAMKQSLKAILPQIDAMTTYRTFLEQNTTGRRFIAYCDPSIPRRLFAKEYTPYEDTTILIGPEGDFSTEEIRDALDSGWLPVSLGDNRLRTETAALVACDTCHIINQLHQ